MALTAGARLGSYEILAVLGSGGARQRRTLSGSGTRNRSLKHAAEVAYL
jgi:hypothetical protein